MKDTKAKSKDSKLSVKNDKAKKRQARKERKAKKDPNKPKRPPTPFFIYLEEFRKIFKEQHPDVKGVSEVARACGEKWKVMSAQEKAPYEEKGAQRRAEYEKTLTAYNQKMSAGAASKREMESKQGSSNSENLDDEGDDDDEEDEE
ncbi:hypothetical protein GOP47_0014294 [Adiantum capillus-veneris]|uniref:HMG box domain-containing protein n=1 Tax=Adiantum capillus-veneris TaxID=13818 RepID=A0A9D4ULB2_ADICA|nr:hypothetical protein GOP47_0014294 [Adiantum capillus-veneris]